MLSLYSQWKEESQPPPIAPLVEVVAGDDDNGDDNQPPPIDSAHDPTETATLTGQDHSSSQGGHLMTKANLYHAQGGIRLNAIRFRESKCLKWCSCQCHRTTAVQTPDIAKILIGSLFIGYNGIPSFAKRCSEKSCRRQSKPTLKVSYHFPTWLLNRMFQFAVSSTPLDGPRISIHMPRIVPDNSEVFVCAVRGNLAGMISLFERGVASPFDVGSGTGRTPLHVSINHCSIPIPV